MRNSDHRGAATDPNVRYLFLTGILTPKLFHDSAVTPGLENLKRHSGPPRSSEAIVLHRREVLRREGGFSALRDEKVETEFDEELINLVENLPYRITMI